MKIAASLYTRRSRCSCTRPPPHWVTPTVRKYKYVPRAYLYEQHSVTAHAPVQDPELLESRLHCCASGSLDKRFIPFFQPRYLYLLFIEHHAACSSANNTTRRAIHIHDHSFLFFFFRFLASSLCLVFFLLFSSFCFLSFPFSFCFAVFSFLSCPLSSFLFFVSILQLTYACRAYA